MSTNENMIGVRADFIMADFDRHVKEYNARLAEANKTTEQFYKETEQQTKQHSAQIGQSLLDAQHSFIEFAAKVTAIIGVVAGAYKTLKDAANFRAMIIAGNNLATSYGVNFQKLLDDFEEVTRGALTMEEKVSLANKALAAGGAGFVNQIGPLYKIARAAAVATGRDTSEVFQVIIQGIAKAQPRMITQADIYLKLRDVVDDYAKANGVAVESIDLETQRQLVLNAVLEQGGDLVRRVGDDAIEAKAGFKQFEVSITETKDVLGLAAAEILKVGGVLNFLASGFERLDQVIAVLAGGVVGGITLVTTFWSKLQGVRKDILGLPEITPRELGDFIAEAQRAANEAFGKTVLNVSEMVKPNEANVETGALATAAAAEAERQKADQEKRAEQLKNYNDKIQDLQIKSGESILDAEKDFHDKSAKAWSDYIKKTNDIIAEGISARAKIQQTYNDKISNAERDYQRGLEDANYSHGQKLASIERDYQDTIRNIQQTYQEDALDAVRNLDAIGLLRAKEKRDKDLASAAQTRDRAISDEQENYARSLYELARALSDKRDEADRDRRRDLDEQRQNERDKLDTAQQAYNDQQTEAQNAFDARIAAIRSQYNQEDIEAQAHYLNQETLLKQHLDAMRALMAAYGIGGGTLPTTGGAPRGRAAGGVDIVSTPTQFTAGEAGPEMTMFIPLNRALPSPVSQTVNHVGDFSHSIEAAIGSSVAGLDGRIVAAVRKAIGEVVR
jgi:hypothetical protein